MVGGSDWGGDDDTSQADDLIVSSEKELTPSLARLRRPKHNRRSRSHSLDFSLSLSFHAWYQESSFLTLPAFSHAVPFASRASSTS